MKIYSTVFRAIRRYLFAGLGVLVPLFISLYIIFLLFSFSERFAGKFINTYLKDIYGFKIPGLGFFIILIVLAITGFIATRFIGKKLLLFFERIFIKLPLVAILYPSVKKLSDFFLKSEKQKEFKKAVLVEFPYEGAYSMGFVTNENLELLNTAAGKKLISVFIPFAPAPFSGFIMLVSREKIKPLDVPFETVIKYIVSGGVVFELGKQKFMPYSDQKSLKK